jgi:polysaccharide pyruvyl transferase WcaK-like protein
VRIGLIGWYGHENAGDERILACLRRFFGDHELLVTTSYADAAGRVQELDSCDFVLLGGGGLILRGTGSHAKLIRDLRPRFGCIGLGVEACHRDNIRLIEAIKDRSEFMLVRDERSRQLLDCPRKTVVGPDLTFLYPYDIVPEAEADVCGLNLRPWVSWHGEFWGTHDRVMRKLDARWPSLVALSPFSKWSPDRAVATLSEGFDKLVPLPLYLEPAMQNDQSVLSAHFEKVPSGFPEEEMDRCRFVASMRFHGLVFACQKGIPFLSFSYQPKNERFCQALGMEHLSLSLFDLSRLGRAIHDLKSNRAALRKTLLDARASYNQEISSLMADVYRTMVGTAR